MGRSKTRWKSSQEIKNQLKDINIIFSTGGVFAALSNGGKVIVWGEETLSIGLSGRPSEEIKNKLKETSIKTIVPNRATFAALSYDGSVIIWGHKRSGGEPPENIKRRLKNIKKIVGTDRAFAALTQKGTVICWGYDPELEDYGGDPSTEIQNQLKNIDMIFSNFGAFAALTDENKVVVWGNSDYGGTPKIDISTKLLTMKVAIIVPNENGFDVEFENGDRITW